MMGMQVKKEKGEDQEVLHITALKKNRWSGWLAVMKVQGRKGRVRDQRY